MVTKDNHDSRMKVDCMTTATPVTEMMKIDLQNDLWMAVNRRDFSSMSVNDQLEAINMRLSCEIFVARFCHKLEVIKLLLTMPERIILTVISWSDVSKPSVDGLYAILQLIDRANLKKLVIPDNMNRLSSFVRATERKSVFQKITKVSSEFKRIIHQVQIVSGSGYSVSTVCTYMMLMRLVHGEEKVIEIINRVFDENSEASFEELTYLADSWDEAKDLPLSWSVQLAQVSNR